VCGVRLDLAATRTAIAGALPLYRTLAVGAPTAYLCDEAAIAGAERAFCMAAVSSRAGCAAYQSATTFSRVAEVKVCADVKG
jgi:hypothetical protein